MNSRKRFVLHSAIMSNIIWLASYPKSGNTWMRTLLANYLGDSDEPAHINQLGGGPIASARQVFDDRVGIEASDLTPEEIDRLRPLVYEHVSAEAKETVFLKVHDAFTYNDAGHPVISKTATKGVLYLLRNPLDVAVSFAHHNDAPMERMVKQIGKRDFAFCDNKDRLPNQLRQQLLTWSQHALSWIDEPGLDVQSSVTKICRAIRSVPSPTSFAFVNLRRSPIASRPPSNFHASTSFRVRSEKRAFPKRCVRPDRFSAREALVPGASS